MRLRKSVRAPDGFEDEAMSFNLPKKKQITTPAFPAKMRDQWVPFNQNAPAAAFPSLPLNGATVSPSARGEHPGLIAHNNHSDEVADSRSDIIEIHTQSQPIQAGNMNHDQFTATANGQNNILNPDPDTVSPTENSRIAWSSLELPVQYRIWTSLRRNYSQEDAVIFLRLSPEELSKIRIAVEKRCQYPIDSSEILKRLDALDDHDGSLLGQFTPYLLVAQSYELAYPEEVERGVKFLSQLDLDRSRLGAWTPDPERSGFFKAMPSGIGRGFDQELDQHIDFGFSSPGDDNRTARAPALGEKSRASESIALQHATVFAQPLIPTDTVPRARIQRYASNAEYSQALQASAAKHRDQYERESLQSQALPRTRRPQVVGTSVAQDTSPPTTRDEIVQPPARHPVIIKNGIDPLSLPPPDVAVSNPLGAPPSGRSIPVIKSIEPSDTDQGTRFSPPSQISSGDRSSGSMSLRSRDRLRDTQALVALKQNLSYWDDLINEISDSGNDDDIADLPLATQQKSVSLKINNKSALASIFQGGREIRAKYASIGSNLSTARLSTIDITDDQASRNLSDPYPSIPAVRDEPALFASYFTCQAFPEDESKRLLAVPVEERNTVEMWLIYGSNTWNRESPWNAGRAVPRHERPADGAMLNRDRAGSLLARTLVDEWNRAQTHGLGERIVEATDIGTVMVTFHQRMLEAQGERDELNQFEEGVEDSSATDRSKIKRDAHRLYMGEVQNLLRRVHGRIDRIYANQFEQLRRPMPIMRHRTPSIIRTSETKQGEKQPSAETDGTRMPSLPTMPHRPSHKATGNGFAMRLIGTPSTHERRPATLPEDNHGIFDSDGMGGLTVDQVSEFKEDEEKSPRRPSWSPISDDDNDEDFHSAVGTLSAPTSRSPNSTMPQVMQSLDNLSSLLFELVSRRETPASTVGEASAASLRKESSFVRQLSATSMLHHTEDRVLRSIESDQPELSTGQLGSTTVRPILKLTLRVPSTTPSMRPGDSAPSSTAGFKQRKGNFKPTTTHRDATHNSDATTRVTRSISTTPAFAQSDVPTQVPSTIAKANGSSVTKSKAKMKGCKATRSKTEHAVNPQIEAVKSETDGAIPIFGRGTQAKPRSTGKAGSRSAITELAKAVPQLTGKVAPKPTGTPKTKTTQKAATTSR